MLSRDEILAADDLPTETVAVKAWGGEVCIRALSGVEQEAFTDWQEKTKPGKVLSMAGFVACSIVDENGARVFTTDDAPTLAKKNPKSLFEVFSAAMKLSKRVGVAIEGKSAPTPG
jgi:hypothetical protein